ncbi:MAG: PocR ligand-binding domain-containing protein [Clostridia bacterium]|nr:PocR ligand-binding domain-containing protein [Clostridia bacterium]
MPDYNDINSILRDFYKISGFRVSVHDTEYNEVYSYPEKNSSFCRKIQSSSFSKANCIKCDKAAFQVIKEKGEAYVYRCHCGLYEAAAPIFHHGVLTGYIMMGQVRDEGEESLKQIEKCTAYAFADTEEQKQYVKDISAVPLDKIESYVNIMRVIAHYFTKYNRIESQASDLAEHIRKYINISYRKKMTLEGIAEKFGCCKSTAMNCFKKKYGMTIISYLNYVRLENAEQLIRDTDLSFKEIAYECGFYDQNYFSKVFSEKFGCSPSVFRSLPVNNETKS